MKDAKGHGSNSRGAGLEGADYHQHKIAVDTVKNPLKGQFLGGPSATEAEATLRNKFGYGDADIAKLTGAELARGGAPGKSEPAPVHPAQAQQPHISDTIGHGDKVTFTDRFGQSRSGKAVMRGPAGWVLNMGGAHGTPAVPHPDSITKVRKAKTPGPRI